MQRIFMIPHKLLAYVKFNERVCSMVNNLGQTLLVIGEQDGEILFKVGKNESINIRNKKQTNSDKYYSANVKIKGRFVKVMWEEREVVDMLIKYPSTYMALAVMKRYLVTNYNVLLKNGKKYKCSDLAKDLGVSRQSASTHINKLKELNILGEVETTKGKLYCINPYYYIVGEEVPQNILNVFEKQKR